MQVQTRLNPILGTHLQVDTSQTAHVLLPAQVPLHPEWPRVYPNQAGMAIRWARAGTRVVVEAMFPTTNDTIVVGIICQHSQQPDPVSHWVGSEELPIGSVLFFSLRALQKTGFSTLLDYHSKHFISAKHPLSATIVTGEQQGRVIPIARGSIIRIHSLLEEDGDQPALIYADLVFSSDPSTQKWQNVRITLTVTPTLTLVRAPE